MISGINTVHVQLTEKNETIGHDASHAGSVEDRPIQFSKLWAELVENGGKIKSDRGFEYIQNCASILKVYSYSHKSDAMELHPVVRVIRKFYTAKSISIAVEQAGRIEMTNNQSLMGITVNGTAKITPETDQITYGYSAESLKLMNKMKILETNVDNFNGYMYSLDTSPYHNFMVDNVMMWDFSSEQIV